MKRTKPDYNKAKNVAYQALEKHQISNFPINILEVLKSYKDIKIITYSEMAQKRNCSIDEIITANSSEDGSIHYSADRDKYLIAYNDSVSHKERVYWTLAHEFGHYLLNHHKEANKATLYRNDMNDNEYDILEVEANFFARFFLSPPPVIVEAKLNSFEKVMEFFGVSYSAATITLNYIEESSKKGYRFKLPNKIEMYLKSFVEKVIHGKTCRNCNVFFHISLSKHCPICGETDFHIISKGDEIDMKYPGVNVTSEGKAIICPICENSETNIVGEYCIQCGTNIVNTCTGFAEDYNGYTYPTCPEPLMGNVRFCPKCGSESTFKTNGILNHWYEIGKDEMVEDNDWEELRRNQKSWSAG